MLLRFIVALSLLALTVAIHAAGLTVLLRRMLSRDVPRTGFWPVTGLLIRVASWLIFIHLAGIVVWALFYWWEGCLPDAESSFYFSGVTYTTVGYGDLVLPKEWRLLGPVEALTGILMCGLSTGVFFAIVSRIFWNRARTGGAFVPEKRE